MDLDQICYKKNFLSKVIVKIDFLYPNESLLRSLKKKVSQEILHFFPISEPRKAVAHELKITREDVEQKKREGMEWHFFGRQREKEFIVTPHSLILVHLAYYKFENLFNEFSQITNAFFEYYDEIQANRLGLRYINDIRFPKEEKIDWKKYINNSLLCLLDFNLHSDKLIRIFHNIDFNHDDFLLKFQFGIHNPDYPAFIKQNSFILDLDAFFNGLILSGDINYLLNSFHNKIQELFEFSITDELRSVLNE